MPPTIRKLLAADNKFRFETRALLREITGFADARLISLDDYQLSAAEHIKYQDMLQRLLNDEPLAYILGYKEFYSRLFRVSPATLIPRPETELVVDMIIKKAPFHGHVLELGTGCGCIAISCKLERPDLQISASDKYPATLAIAKHNAGILAAKINFVCSNWYAAIGGKFNLIVSNPPYIHPAHQNLVQLGYEPLNALTDFVDGLQCIREIAASAANYLVNGGWLVLEHGYDHGNVVRDILAANGLVNIETICDYAGLERISYGQAPGNYS